MARNRPLEPSDDDCCGSGCDPCVFDVYRQKLQLYEKYASGQLQQPPSTDQPNLISDTKYTAFEIISLRETCEHHSIIVFKHKSGTDGRKLIWKPGQHFLMKFSTAELVKSKAYTPLRLPDVADCDYDFLIVVKRYPEGLVSSYLHSRQVGDEVLWRGPYGCYDHVPNKFKRICMIAQGTGIAPLYSIINIILLNGDDYTKVILFCCYKNVETILLRKELYSFRQYWNYNYAIFVSEKIEENISVLYKEPIMYRKLHHSDLKNYMWPLDPKDAFIVCGSEKFINCYVEFLLNEGGNKDQIIQI